MRNAMDAALVGAGAGVGATASLLLAALYLAAGRVDSISAIAVLMGVSMGPGLVFVLTGIPIASRLLTWTEERRSTGAVLSLGTVLGLGVGAALLGLGMFLFFPDGMRNIAWASSCRLLVVSALPAGGATMGLACAWSLTRPPEEPA